MIITKKTPSEWKDLQQKVGEILDRCGFNVEIEKTVETVRGNVEIDVYAEEIVDGRKYIIICECKNWKQNIPQNVIHGFRTLVADLGCNAGYIITTSDFQSGSKKANEYTNIELLTWEGFQAVFFESWYSGYFYEKLQTIREYQIDNIKIQFFQDYDLIERHVFRDLIDKYNFIDDVYHHFPSPIFKNFPNMAYEINHNLPLKDNIDSGIFCDWELFGYDIPNDLLNESSYEEFLNKFSAYAKPVFNALSNLDIKLDYNDYD